MLYRIAEDIALDFLGLVSFETVDRLVAESYARLIAQSPTPAFPAIFTERLARERLEALSQSQGSLMNDNVPEVLFVCVHDAGRSQMAAALLQHHARGSVRVRSAGSAPGEQVHSGVAAAMAEIGLDLSGEVPKLLTDETVRAADVVVTMGCGDACPLYPGKRYVDWELADPAGKPGAEVRPIRDEIDRRVQVLLAELTSENPPGGLTAAPIR